MYARIKTQIRAKALAYLKAKYPEADENAFYTDYTGRIYDEVIQVWTVAQAAEADEICGSCEGKLCKMPEAIRVSHPVVRVSKSPR